MRTLFIAAVMALVVAGCGAKAPGPEAKKAQAPEPTPAVEAISIPDGWTVPKGIVTVEGCDGLESPDRDYCREALSETAPPERPTRQERPQVEAVAPGG